MKNNENIINWVIYKITSPSGRVYIGKTCNFKARMRCYKHIQKKVISTPINKSMRKYGFENHIIDIIDTFSCTQINCDGKEMFWIRSYMSNVHKWPNGNGLNVTDGGEGMIGNKMSEETKNKLRQYNTLHPPIGMKGKKMSAESREKMSIAKKGKTPHNKGKKMPSHQVELLRNINKGRPSPLKGIKFNGTEEDRKEKFGKHNIGNTYNTGRKQRSEVVEMRRINQIGKSIPKKWKPIIKFDIENNFICEYPSITNATKESKICESSIINVLKGRFSQSNGYVFKYK